MSDISVTVNTVTHETTVNPQIAAITEVNTIAQNTDLFNYVPRSETGLFLGSGQAEDIYYPRSNPSGFASGIDASSLVSKTTFNSFTGKLIKFSSYLNSGQQTQFINYPFLLSSSPIINCEIENNMDTFIYSHVISSINLSGFTINFSDLLSNTGYKLHTTANL